FSQPNASGTINHFGAGAVEFFTVSGGVWTHQQRLVASDRALNDQFGISVSISGDYMAIGANAVDNDTSGTNTLLDAGAVYIFKRSSGSWSQLQRLNARKRSVQANFGYSLDLSGDTLVIGGSDNYSEVDLDSLRWAGAVYF